MFGKDPVEEALQRWTDRGLLDDATARRLRAEAEQTRRRGSTQASQRVLAVAGGTVLLIAAGVLTDWLWPLLDQGARAIALVAVGIAVHAVGIWLEGRARWVWASRALQTAGLLVMLGGFLHSERTWPDVSPGGIALGLIALATPLLTAPRALHGDAVMPAVHVALAPAFLAVFLDRATGLSGSAIVWLLDVGLGLLVLGMVREIGRRLRRGDSEESVDAMLYAFLTAVYAGGVLVGLTGAIALELEEATVWAVDAWWIGATALTLWAAHRAPEALRREWFGDQIAASVLLAIPLVPYTAMEVSGWTHSGPGELVLALVGGLGIGYGLGASIDRVVRAGALTVVVAAWWFGLGRGGAVGVVAALALTAILLLWLSARVGTDDDGEG